MREGEPCRAMRGWRMADAVTFSLAMAGLDWPTLYLVAAGILGGLAANQALYREAPWDFTSSVLVCSVTLLAAFCFYRWYRTVSVWM
jgi:uncharacterized membrane protein